MKIKEREPNDSVWGINVPYNLAQIIVKRANKENSMIDVVLLELVQKGLECERLCKRRKNG